MLKRAISSALKQSYEPLEIVVVDDNGSQRENSQYVRDVVFSFHDPRLRLVHNKTNLGGAGARNVGIQESRGSYIAFLDDDDEYLPDKIKLSVERFEQSSDSSLAIVYAYAESVDENGATYLNDGHYEGCCPDKLLELRGLAATTQFVCKKSALVAVNGFALVPAKQDSMLLLRLFSAGYTIACIRQPLSLYHEHSGQRISSSGKTIEGEKILQKTGEKLFYPTFSRETITKIDGAYHARLAELYFISNNRAAFVTERQKAIRCCGWLAVKRIYLPVLRIIKKRCVDALLKRK